jgi:hypothetical protein
MDQGSIPLENIMFMNGYFWLIFFQPSGYGLCKFREYKWFVILLEFILNFGVNFFKMTNLPYLSPLMPYV